MIEGELKTIETYVQDVEALRHYPEVKTERDSLAGEVAQLREKVRQLTVEVKAEASARKRASVELGKRESEIKNVGRQLREAQEELVSLKAFRAKAPGDAGVPLEEMKGQFLHAQEDEIERRAQERLKEVEKEMRSRMPTLVHKELARVLTSPNWPPEIERVVTLHAARMADERLRDKDRWPDWFKERYARQVQEAVANGLDLEFGNRVRAETQQRLESLKSSQWERYSAAKAKELAADVRAMVSKLRGAPRRRDWPVRDRAVASAEECGCDLLVLPGPGPLPLRSQQRSS